MAKTITFVKRSALPVSVKGKVATDPSVTITGNGQILLNTLATKAMNGTLKTGLAFQDGKCYLFQSGAKALKGLEEKDMIELRMGKKNKTLAFSAATLLKHAPEYGGVAYDFAASGNQQFPVTIDEKNQCITWEIPAGKLTPKPVVKRVKKVKAATSQATPGSTVAEPSKEEELVLEPA